MSGQSTARAVVPTLELGDATVLTPHGPLQLLSARPKAQYSIEEHDAALAELAKRYGPATEGVVARVNESFASFRAELNDAAGGQASSRVMLLSHNAQRAQLAVELQTSLSAVGHGQFAEGKDNDSKQEQVAKGLRNLVGICAFASDLLNKAYDAACAEGKAKRSTVSETQRLFDTIGAGQREIPGHSPIAPPGTNAKGPMLPDSPSSPQSKDSR